MRTVEEHFARAPISAQYRAENPSKTVAETDYPVEVYQSSNFKSSKDAVNCLEQVLQSILNTKKTFKAGFHYFNDCNLRIEVPGGKSFILIIFSTPDQNGQLTPEALRRLTALEAEIARLKK